MNKIWKNKNNIAMLLKITAVIIAAFGILRFIYFGITLPNEHVSILSILNILLKNLGSLEMKALLLLGFGELIEQLYQSNLLRKGETI